ncbi:hypothetical protein LRS71_00035 [Rhodococcus pyridinivorans]|uniref:hypothetical protein n=1 Tax=Rhodococcus pyridinivorans TaxID=103816 RepID=UPI001E539C05|nr:hypothetical protein [Rhodococcus pyridinivorans]MCD5417975.1 hypothetical protein [Rhodococcus pyridinivorans]
MTPDSPIVLFLLIAGIAGLSNSCIWAPLASTATHNLPIHQAGAGAGIYNTTRQVGSVLGSAAIGALISSRMAAQGLGEVQAGEGGGAAMGSGLPEQIAEKFSIVLSQSMLLPASVLSIGIVASTMFVGHASLQRKAQAGTSADRAEVTG